MGRVIALDTETVAFPPRTALLHNGDEINLSAFETPDLVCGSWCDGADLGLMDAPAFTAFVADLLQGEEHLVFHNAPFDIDVLCHADPTLWPLFRQALQDLRIHDTQVLDKRHRLASGYFDRPNPDDGWRHPEVLNRSLDSLSQDYLREPVAKDVVDPESGDVVRLTFGKWKGRFDEMTKLYRDYAKLDARQTYKVHMEILKRSGGAEYGSPYEVRAEVAIYALDKRGLHIDRVEADRLFHLFSQDMPALQQSLVDHGLGEWLPLENSRTKQVYCQDPDRALRQGVEFRPAPDPSETARWVPIGDGKIRRKRLFQRHWTEETAPAVFHLFTLAVREKLEALALDLHIQPKRTEKTDQVSLTADDWKDLIPAEREDLQAWLSHERLKKIIGTYLRLYRQLDVVFPRWQAERARSTRMACARPNVQNVSKRKHGIRSLFVPPPGKLFIKGDYAQQELLTLAQAMLDLGIRGPLFEAIKRGTDLHTTTARLVFLSKENTEVQQWIQKNLQKNYLDIAESLPVDAGSGRGPSIQMDTDRSPENNCSFTDSLTNYSLEKYPPGLLCSMPATTRVALIRSICGAEPTATICETLRKKEDCEDLVFQDLITLAGRERVHRATQSILEYGVPVTKEQRQASKALNFGFPGGLGAKKLADYARKEYSVVWTIEEAKVMKEKFAAAYPDVVEFLNRHKTDFTTSLIRCSGHGPQWWKEHLGVKGGLWALRDAMRLSTDRWVRGTYYEAERSLTVRLRTGIVRKGCSYTEGANTNFQGLAACVTKEAGWNVHRRGGELLMLVHDELVVSATPDRQEEEARLLEADMLEAFRLICPDTGPYAKVEVEHSLTKWGSATDKEGKAA